MKAVITGANGTVGRALSKAWASHGHSFAKWDRSQVSIEVYQEMEDFLKKEKPDVLFHLAVPSQPSGKMNEGWLVTYEWTSELAWITRQLDITFVYTSTVMVFTDEAKGPFTIEHTPNAAAGYGYEKLMAEQRAFSQNPESRVVRLGWQIGDSPGTNNMIDFFDRNMREHGHIGASETWLPACSFLEDTAEGLIRVVDMPAGLYQLDSNDGWNFYEIAQALNEKHNSPWEIRPNSDFTQDQRMVDKRTQMPSLRQRIPSLP